MKGGDINGLHEGDWSAAGYTAANWYTNYGDISSHMYQGRPDYYLYLKHNTNCTYRKDEGYWNHIHIWNMGENQLGYKLKGGASAWESNLNSVAFNPETREQFTLQRHY